MVKRTVKLVGRPQVIGGVTMPYEVRFRLRHFWHELTGRYDQSQVYRLGIGYENNTENFRFTWTVGDVKFVHILRPQLGALFNMNEDDLEDLKVRVKISLYAGA